MTRLFVALVVAASLSGCVAKFPLEGESSRGRIAHDLGVSADSITSPQRCAISRYDGHASAPAFECAYVATPEYAAVLDFDAASNRFRETLRIGKQTDAIAYATRGSIVGTLGQIQVRHGDQTYVLDFINRDLGTAGHSQDLRDAYEHLRAMGVPVFEALPYVNRQVAPAGGVIFIPAAGRR